jgi:hypothetical protein
LVTLSYLDGSISRKCIGRARILFKSIVRPAAIGKDALMINEASGRADENRGLHSFASHRGHNKLGKYDVLALSDIGSDG